tara:strand:- start:43 stop:327 length:285 start_codon:yes stop_codon:yes gene_type:complete
MAAFTEEQLRWSQNSTQLGNVVKSLDAEISDSADLLDPAPKAIWITAGGGLKVETMGGTIVTFTGLNNDTFIDWLRIKRIYDSDTGANGLFGIY